MRARTYIVTIVSVLLIDFCQQFQPDIAILSSDITHDSFGILFVDCYYPF